MSSDVDPSVQTLRAEAEINRARLTGTVDELRTQVADTATDLKERFSPSAIKAEVTDYVRDSRDQLWHSLEQRARQNPLQAVAVGAAVAYPAFKLLRAMPMPLLLVGAGILLARRSGQNGSSHTTNGLYERARYAADTVQDRARYAADTIQDRARYAADTIEDRARYAADNVTGAMDDATDKARRKLNEAQDYVRAGVDSVTGRAAAAASSIQDRVAQAAGEAKSAASSVADKVIGQGERMVQQARTTVSTTWDQNPLMVAGAGLLIGAVIAAAFPATEVEEKVLGDASDALRRQAQGLAEQGVDAARTAVERAAGAASDQGLSADGLRAAGENLTDKVRAVAERGIEAALDEKKPANTGNSTRMS
jgi:hypothetical protein